jgi:uncharacterized protein YgiM (DUF1202 family)
LVSENVSEYQGRLMNNTAVSSLCIVVVAVTWSATAEAESCSGAACRDKITQVAECTVARSSAAGDMTLLRSQPSEMAQAVGIISRGDKAFISDQKGPWAFIQGEGTYDGKQIKTDGGWILRTYLSDCRQSSE